MSYGHHGGGGGFEQQGYEQSGYDQQYDDQGGYEQSGYEQQGYEQEGYNQHGGYEQSGYEQEGYQNEEHQGGYEGYEGEHHGGHEGYGEEGRPGEGGYEDEQRGGEEGRWDEGGPGREGHEEGRGEGGDGERGGRGGRDSLHDGSCEEWEELSEKVVKVTRAKSKEEIFSVTMHALSSCAEKQRDEECSKRFKMLGEAGEAGGDESFKKLERGGKKKEEVLESEVVVEIHQWASGKDPDLLHMLLEDAERDAVRYWGVDESVLPEHKFTHDPRRQKGRKGPGGREGGRDEGRGEGGYDDRRDENRERGQSRRGGPPSRGGRGPSNY